MVVAVGADSVGKQAPFYPMPYYSTLPYSTILYYTTTLYFTVLTYCMCSAIHLLPAISQRSPNHLLTISQRSPDDLPAISQRSHRRSSSQSASSMRRCAWPTRARSASSEASRSTRRSRWLAPLLHRTPRAACSPVRSLQPCLRPAVLCAACSPLRLTVTTSCKPSLRFNDRVVGAVPAHAHAHASGGWCGTCACTCTSMQYGTAAYRSGCCTCTCMHYGTAICGRA